jgi:hypothetical protein
MSDGNAFREEKEKEKWEKEKKVLDAIKMF